MIASDVRQHHADLAVTLAHQNEVEDVHDPIAVHVTVGVGFHELPVMGCDRRCIEDVDDVIAIGVTGAEQREKKKQHAGIVTKGGKAWWLD